MTGLIFINKTKIPLLNSDKMKKAATLDELLEVPYEDLKHPFGEKTAGLVLLKNMHHAGELEEVPFPKKVGKGFGIQEDCGIDSGESIDKLREFTSTITAPRIIIARSSTYNELPGRFTSTPFLVDPNASREQNDQNWIEAATKVRESGSGPILAHLLSYKLEDFVTHEDFGSHLKQVERTIVKCFGGTPVSFYAKTTTPFGALPGDNRPFNVRFTRGMGTRIANGNNHIILSMEDNNKSHGTTEFNTSWNYAIRVESMFAPTEVDVILRDDPTKFTTIPYNIHTGSVDGMDDAYVYQPLISTLDGTQVPWGRDWLATSENNYTRFQPRHILKLLEIIQNKLGCEIELEGSITDERINLCQLREYVAPVNDFEKLSYVEPERIIISTENDKLGRGNFKGELSIGGKKFEGNLVISREPRPVKAGDILMCGGLAYSVDVSQFKRGNNVALVNYDFLHSDHTQTDIGQHAIGATVSILSRLRDRGVNAISLSPTYVDFMHNPEKDLQGRRNIINHKDTGVKEIPNVVLECTREGTQLYLGKD